MGSDESRFIFINCEGQIHTTVSTYEERGKPKRNRTEIPLLTSLYKALPLGQTGSRQIVPVKFNVALRPQRPYGLLWTGSPGRPPRLSHSS